MDGEEPDFREPEYQEPEYSEPEYEPPEYDEENDEPEGEFIHWPEDPQLAPAKAALLEWIIGHPTAVFYGRQLEVIHEKRYFHWITHKALRALTREEAIATEIRVTAGGNKLRLYWAKRNRYPKRAAAALVRHVEEHSDVQLTRAIGHHAEMLFAVAAGREGFRLHGPAIKAFNGRSWSRTEHDLDWIFERDGVGWGVEIKNTWAYIDRDEMAVKTALCRELGVNPLFIMRWAPKSYIEEVRNGGGFTLLYEEQLFPLGRDEAVEKLRALYLPVSGVAAVPPGIFQRFVRHGHEVRRR